MKAADFEELKAGLVEIKEFADGKKDLKRTSRRKMSFIAPRRFEPEEIRAIRKKNDLSQNDLADALGVKKKTVQAWEASRNVPAGSSARLLAMFDKHPEMISELLEG